MFTGFSFTKFWWKTNIFTTKTATNCLQIEGIQTMVVKVSLVLIGACLAGLKKAK